MKPLTIGVAAFGMAVSAIATATPSYAWEMRVCADFDRLPFSFREETGYENRIAEILADEMGATLVYEWWPYRDVMVNNAVRPGECDIVIGVAEGAANYLTTFSYLRSPFVFVYREAEDYDIMTFDDPILRELRLGVQPRLGPTHQAIVTRGMALNIVETFEYEGGDTNDPLAPAIWAVADGTIDVAIVWGPAAGYYAALSPVPLVVTPVPTFEPPFIPMYINISIGVRIGDDALRDEIDLALAARWEEINAVFEEFNIPTMPLPRPTPTLEARP